MRLLLSVLVSIVLITNSNSQELNYPNPDYRPDTWKGSWITHPEIAQGEAALLHFRRNFELKDAPKNFIINISADNYYTLYVNEKKVCFGPQLGEIRHWRFETVDLSPYLKKGKNTMAVAVVNWGYHRFFGKQSVHTGLTINGYSEAAKIVATDLRNNSWKVLKNKGWHPNIVKWRTANNDIIGGLYANNPTDSIIAKQYPWGWKQRDFNDDAWVDAIFLENTNLNHKGNGFAWLLEPRNLPLLKQEKEYLAQVAKAQGIEVSKQMLLGEQAWHIPPNTEAIVLLDNQVVTTGYTNITFSGGTDASLRLTYAENLFDDDQLKGDRNVIENKSIVGYKDFIRTDGGAMRSFESSWPRTYRFLQVAIQTGKDSLFIEELYNQRTTTPIPIQAEFESSDSTYNKIFDISRRTVELCTQDYYLSDAYYETMQYIGDTKVHALVWQALTASTAHTKNALLQFHQSRMANGLLMSSYPLKTNFIHSTYSMIWVDMLKDYLHYSGDEVFIRQFLPGIEQTLSYFIGRLQSNGLLGAAQYRYFIDWYVDRKKGGGLAPGTDGANSSVVNLHFVHALQSAATLFAHYGNQEQADSYTRLAKVIRLKVGEHSYDTRRKLFAERPDKSFFDQHSNIMAILTDALPKEEQAALIARTVKDTTLAQATFYYRYYLFEALKKTKRPDLLKAVQQPWVDLVKNNASTVMERFESTHKKSRSEVHPWGTSPALFYFTLLAGIQQSDKGWKTLTIRPYLGDMENLTGRYPTPNGIVDFEFHRSGKNKLGVTLEIPKNMEVLFEWNNKTKRLNSGKHQFKL